MSSPYLEYPSCLGISGIFSYITFRLNLYIDMKTCLHNALLKCEDIPHIFLSTKTLFLLLMGGQINQVAFRGSHKWSHKDISQL